MIQQSYDAIIDKVIKQIVDGIDRASETLKGVAEIKSPDAVTLKIRTRDDADSRVPDVTIEMTVPIQRYAASATNKRDDAVSSLLKQNTPNRSQKEDRAHQDDDDVDYYHGYPQR